MSEVYIFDNR